MAELADAAERPRDPLQAPMTALLAERECGLWRPPALERLVKEARARNVRLSDCRDIDPPFPGSEVSCMAIDEVEDRYLLCGFADGSLAIVDVEERPGAKPLKFEAVVRIDRAQGPHARGHSFGISGLAWYPKDTGLFVTGSFDKTVKVWDTNSEQEALKFDVGDHVYGLAVQSMAQTHSLLAVACGDQRVALLDMASGGRKNTLLGHRGPVHAVQWSTSDEFILATGGADGTVRVWDIRRTHTCRSMLNQDGPAVQLQGSGNDRKRQRQEASSGVVPQAHSGGISGLLYSPHGRHLVSSGADGRMRLWHPQTGEMQIVNFGAFPQNAQSNYKRVQMAISWNANVVFHPRGNDVIVCDLESGDRMACLSAHMATVYCCVAQPHREAVFSGGRDSNLLVWHPPLTSAAAEEDEVDLAQDAWSDDDHL